ncbi:hypothetical protein ACTFIY_011755 [Dictyostelium cf. discoideum]
MDFIKLGVTYILRGKIEPINKYAIRSNQVSHKVAEQQAKRDALHAQETHHKSIIKKIKSGIIFKRKLVVLEWIKDFFNQNNEVIDRGCNDLIQLIEDGVVLCKLINLYFPGRIDKINYQKSMGSTKYFLLIENINSFIAMSKIWSTSYLSNIGFI